VPDISLGWNSTLEAADWTLAPSGDIATGGDLENAVFLSLFTDCAAPADFTPPDGDPRGWWADAFTGDPFGSWLWLLPWTAHSRLQTLQLAKSYSDLALAWLISDGIGASIDVTPFWLNGSALALKVVVTEPSGAVSRFTYSWAWSQT
jgi:phage gp46-like protein